MSIHSDERIDDYFAAILYTEMGCLSVFKDDESNPWKHIKVSKARLLGVSCFDSLTFLSDGDCDDAECFFGLQQLFHGLAREKCCPVVICLDQWNAMERDYWTDGMKCSARESHPLMQDTADGDYGVGEDEDGGDDAR
jgi:hypothetical protein